MPSTARGYPYPVGGDAVDVPGDIQAAVQAVNDDVDAVEDVAAAATAALTTTVSDLDTASEPAFSTWKPLRLVGNRDVASLTTTLNLLPLHFSGNVAVGSNANVGTYGFTLDPSDFTAGSRTTQYRLRLTIYTNSVAPAVDFVAELQKVNGPFGGGSSSAPFINSVTAAGNTATVSAPPASSVVIAVSTAFTAPVASVCAIGLRTASGTQAANSVVGAQVELMYRQT